MKKFTKLFLSCAAVAAVTAAVATSAMAADKTLTAKYTVEEGAATGTLTITCDSQDDMKTLLVLKPGADLTNVKDTDIIQIDQNENIATAVLPVYSEDVEEDKGTYTVLMGGSPSGDIYKGTFKIGSSVLVGDVNFSEDITLADATCIVLDYVGTNPITDEDAKIAADTNFSNDITLADATCIVNHYVGNTSGAGHVGETK